MSQRGRGKGKKKGKGRGKQAQVPAPGPSAPGPSAPGPSLAPGPSSAPASAPGAGSFNFSTANIFAYDVTGLVGQLDDHSYRRRLIFVRRHFTSEKNLEISANLVAAEMTGNPTRLHWLPFDTTFMSDERREEMVRRVAVRVNRTEEDIGNQLRHFSVVIGSLPYIHKIYDPIPLEQFFRNEHYRQPGAHVFVSLNGIINMVYTQINTDQSDQYDAFTYASVTSIFPVIRYNWNTTGQQIIAYGLIYDLFNDYVEGNRYYHRYGEQLLSAGGVYEFTQIHLDGMDRFKTDFLPKKEAFSQYCNFIAFYVCVGAKLVVVDEYQIDRIGKETVENHNRTLIQQGGFVSYRGVQIKISKPVRRKKSDDGKYDKIHNQVYTWDDFWLKHCPNLWEKIKNYKQPVVFLGATDSKYNSIAWTFTIDTKHFKQLVTGTNRVATLKVPMGAQIITVEDGADGLDQIKARIQYEMLHDSVVYPHNTQFKAPDIAMAKKILNLGKSSYNVDFNADLHSNATFKDLHQERAQPKEFNFSYVTEMEPDDKLLNRMTNHNMRLPVPPMYPPVLERDTNGVDHYIYMPSQNIPVGEVDKCYSYVGNQLIVKINGEEYDYKEQILSSGHHFQRMSTEEDNRQDAYKNRTGRYHLSEGRTIMTQPETQLYRIGVDGWMWKKIEDTPIYKEHIYCLAKALSRRPPTLPSSPPRGLPPAPKQEKPKKEEVPDSWEDIN